MQGGQGRGTLHVAEATLKHGRELRLQPFNRYREKLGLKPYTSFEELTGILELSIGNRSSPAFTNERFEFLPFYRNALPPPTGEREIAAGLKELYGDIDALEFYVGLMLEKKREKQLFGSTVTELGAPYSLKGTQTCVL